MRRRAIEARRRQYEREALIAGGSVGLGFVSLAKWPVLLELFGGFFRLIGGPTLVSAALRTPGNYQPFLMNGLVETSKRARTGVTVK